MICSGKHLAFIWLLMYSKSPRICLSLKRHWLAEESRAASVEHPASRFVLLLPCSWVSCNLAVVSGSLIGIRVNTFGWNTSHIRLYASCCINHIRSHTLSVLLLVMLKSMTELRWWQLGPSPVKWQISSGNPASGLVSGSVITAWVFLRVWPNGGIPFCDFQFLIGWAPPPPFFLFGYFGYGLY